MQVVPAKKADDVFAFKCPRCGGTIVVESDKVLYNTAVIGRVDCNDCPWQDYVLMEVQQNGY